MDDKPSEERGERGAVTLSRPDPLPGEPESEVPGYERGDPGVHVEPKSLPHNHSPRREQFGRCAVW
jgi:hypothetical protein